MVASGVTIPVMTINGSKTRSIRRCAGEPVFNKYMPIISFALFGSVGRGTPDVERFSNLGLGLTEISQCRGFVAGSERLLRASRFLRKRLSFSDLQILVCIKAAEQLDQLCHQARPTGLMAGSETRAVIAVEVLVE
jgi:hypothetical protein